MPFERSVAHAFRVGSILAHAPSVSGVYGISNAREWIFIGQSDNIQRQLLDHLQEDGTFLKGRLPTGFVYEMCDDGVRAGRVDRLVQEYGPAANERRRK